jgi:hypothetical protein
MPSKRTTSNIRVIIFSRKDKRFYPLVGPFLSNRQIVAELGFPIWDDPSKIWFIALQGRRLVGICASVDEGDSARFTSDYVLPE